MDSFLKADIFFFISTVFTILIGIFLLVFLFYMLRIARDAKEISKRVRNSVRNISDDVESKRKKIKEQGISLADIASFFSPSPKRSTKRKASPKKTTKKRRTRKK